MINCGFVSNKTSYQSFFLNKKVNERREYFVTVDSISLGTLFQAYICYNVKYMPHTHNWYVEDILCGGTV